MQVNRVRAGPFAKLDEMNRARTRLSEEKIVSTIIRQ
jgi:cell division protein FtsN